MSNNSGITQVVINTRERAVSTDINRLQTEQSKARANMAKRMYNNIYEWEAASNSGQRASEIETSKEDVPMSMDIFGGLRVIISGDFLTVSAGSCGIKAESGSFDVAKDSDYLLVDDPGVTDISVLPFTQNLDTGRVCEIIEAAVNDVVLKSESRDIYDPLTGLFTPSLITKIAAARLTYRIRRTTGGAGTWAGTVINWTPLAVAVHEGLSTSFNNVTFYDVRPLIIDRHDGMSRRTMPPRMMTHKRFHMGMEFITTTTFIGGTYDFPIGGPGTNAGFNIANQYRAFGTIGQTLPGKPDTGSDAVRIDVEDADYWANGAPTPNADRWVYFGVQFPHNLPRWIKYGSAVNPVTGGREPGQSMGLFSIAAVVGDTVDGGASGFPIPAAYGIGGANEQFQIILPIRQDSESSFSAFQWSWNNTDYLRYKAIGPSASAALTSGVVVTNLNIRYLITLGTPGNTGDFLPSFVQSGEFDLTVQYEIAQVTNPQETLTVEYFLQDTVLAEQVSATRKITFGELVAARNNLAFTVPIQLTFQDRYNYPNPTDGGLQVFQLVVDVFISGISATDVIGLGADGATIQARGWKFGF